MRRLYEESLSDHLSFVDEAYLMDFGHIYSYRETGGKMMAEILSCKITKASQISNHVTHASGKQ